MEKKMLESREVSRPGATIKVTAVSVPLDIRAQIARSLELGREATSKSDQSKPTDRK